MPVGVDAALQLPIPTIKSNNIHTVGHRQLKNCEEIFLEIHIGHGLDRHALIQRIIAYRQTRGNTTLLNHGDLAVMRLKYRNKGRKIWRRY
jgi:hypothetical protein